MIFQRITGAFFLLDDGALWCSVPEQSCYGEQPPFIGMDCTNDMGISVPVNSLKGPQDRRDNFMHRLADNLFLSTTPTGTVEYDDERRQHILVPVDDFISSSYVPFYDDFGPVNLSTVHKFCELLDNELLHCEGKSVAVHTSHGNRNFTNTVFLLGAYMITKLDMTTDDVGAAFEPISDRLIPFRDVSPEDHDFGLLVCDCWSGLWRAAMLRWFDFGPDGFDRADYDELDSPMNADLHVVVPGKLLAMRGPRDLAGGARWQDAHQPGLGFSHRDFAPEHYADILRQFDVRAVVRLNEAEYDAAGFRAAGIAVADLAFDDCTPPPTPVVAAFLALAEGLPGALAVHCRAGLGRTGTLIALYMMKHHGFTARGAMGWLRVVRPGSVIGPQQRYLCDSEALMRRAGDAFRLRGGGSLPPAPADADLLAVEAHIAAVSTDVRRRAAAATAFVRGTGAAAATAVRGCGGSRRASCPASAGEAVQLAAHVSAAAALRARRLSGDCRGGEARAGGASSS